jgi:acyl carrier protein
LVGKEAGDLDPTTTFLRLGFESLLLMQASRAVEAEFGIRVPFRKLILGLATIQDLSAYLDKVLPPDAAGSSPHIDAAAPSTEASLTSLAPTPSADRDGSQPATTPPQVAGDTSESSLEQIVMRQLALMEAQLELLRAHASPTRASSPVRQASEPSVLDVDGRGEGLVDHMQVRNDQPADRAETDRVERIDRRAPAFVESDAAGRRDEQTKTFPLTPAQRQIWVHTQLGDDFSRAYNDQRVFGLRGRLDLDALRAAVDDVTAHHESLRTIFDTSGEVEHVLGSLPADFRVAAPESVAGRDRLADAMHAAARETFDLGAGPLLRVHVYPRGSEDHLIQLVFHHIVMDGLGSQVLLRDLECAYSARSQGKRPELASAMQFSEYAGL